MHKIIPRANTRLFGSILEVEDREGAVDYILIEDADKMKVSKFIIIRKHSFIITF